MLFFDLQVGSFATNCYIVACEETREAAVIDPGDSAARILSLLEQHKLNVKAILLTHGHVDHIGALGKVKEVTGAPVMLHQADAEMLTSSSKNLSAYFGSGITYPKADRLLKDGDSISIGHLTFEVFHTPGHTPGGISFKVEDILISGDTLFAESIGRTDFPGGSYAQLIEAIKTKLYVLPDGTKVYPGHGASTSIGWEKKHNPFTA